MPAISLSLCCCMWLQAIDFCLSGGKWMWLSHCGIDNQNVVAINNSPSTIASMSKLKKKCNQHLECMYIHFHSWIIQLISFNLRLEVPNRFLRFLRWPLNLYGFSSHILPYVCESIWKPACPWKRVYGLSVYALCKWK